MFDSIFNGNNLGNDNLSKRSYHGNLSSQTNRDRLRWKKRKKQTRISEGKRDGREEGESEKSDIRNKAKLIFCLAQPLRVVVRGETGVFQAN